MCRFPALKDLHRFACQRSLEGCEQWLPIHLKFDNFHISVLPGDDLYPEEVDFYGKHDGVLRIEKSLEDFQKESSNLHRIIFQDPHTVHMNISPKYNHMAPLFSETVGGHYKSSKL
ncbi:acyl-coenzyme A diphosphatase NUDT19-like [Misgurnus anguillicaudatus]|uniref:acyl-coenzyme A diphosphatase NUDT19-like n=1 Tax=Misgurnus anguillicaudatus TaxID=75329 RepID=UPI003CCF491D